jgi:hypothetical protein
VERPVEVVELIEDFIAADIAAGVQHVGVERRSQESESET